MEPPSLECSNAIVYDLYSYLFIWYPGPGVWKLFLPIEYDFYSLRGLMSECFGVDLRDGNTM